MPRGPHRLRLPRPRRSASSGASLVDTTRVNIPRELCRGDGGLNLATALKHGPFTGLARPRAFIRELTERPIDVRWKVVPVYGQGMRPDALRAILAG